MFVRNSKNLSLRFVLILVFSFGALGAIPARAQSLIYRVTPAGATSGSCGGDWSSPCDLQYTLTSLASAGDQIWVAAGTYKPTSGTDRMISFALKNGVEVYGGFDGTETLLKESDSAANVTILSGDLNGDDAGFTNNGENSYHVVTGSGTDNTAVLNGFMITGGNADDYNTMSYESHGGGLFILSGNPMLANLTISGNSAWQGGGIANHSYSSPTLANVTISGNSAIALGGGIYNYFHSDPTLTNVTLSGNSTSQQGGGIYNVDSNPILTSVTLSGNVATYGGAILNNTSNPTLTNVTISGNSATSYGGGIYNYFHSDPILNNVTLSGNSAPYGGGGIYNHESSNPAIYNTILWSNGSQIGNADLSTTTIKDSIVQGGCPVRATCTEIINSDPLLGSLQDNGGFTPTMALGTGSTAIDAGGVNSNCAVTDQRGVTRPQSRACDIGAYELEHEFIEVLYVKPGGFTMGVCESWIQACELRYALSRATAGQQIWVAAGTYKPTSGTDRTISFALKHRVKIYGGFAGTETLLSQRDPKTNLTILNGDLNGDDSGFTNNGENSYHVVVGSGNYGTAVLDGFTITGGNANGSDPNNNGGGLYNYYGSPILANLTIRGNSAAQYGGGVYNDTHSSPALTNVIIKGNFAVHGGGMYNEHSSPTLTNVTINGNSAVDGGGMYNRIIGSQPTLTNVTISNNIATSTGGGMFNVLRSLPTLTNVTISGNSAPQAGGLYNSGSSPTLVNVILWGNGTAMNNVDTSAPTVVNSVVQGGCPSTASCTNVIDADPLLGALQDNGGFTETMALGTGSPAINTGNDVNCPATDQRGVTRPQGSGCDIGAFEFVPFPTATPTNTPTATLTPTVTPPYSYNPLYISLTGNQTIGGVSFADEDILRFDGQTWSLFFDGSDVGVGSPDLFAFSILDSDTILMSFSANVTVNGIAATPQDVLRFDATSLGSTTSGTWSLYFDGSDVGFDTTAENIDSLTLLPDGRLLFSTTGSPLVPGLTGILDEDILAFSPVTLGNTTSGSWSWYFDGSDVGLSNASSEDIDGLDVTSNSNIYLSTMGDFAVTGISGADEDVFVCVPSSLGSTTVCSYSPTLYFDGSTWGLAANDVDAFNFLPLGPVATATLSNTPTNTPIVTSTPTRTNTPPATPTRTNTPVGTSTQTPSPTATFTRTATSTLGPVLTNTPTPSFTPTNISTATKTPTPTSTATSTPTFSGSSFMFLPVDDAYIASGSPATNYGASTSLQVDNSPIKHILIKFAVSGLNGNQVTRAKLRFYNVDASSKGGDLYAVTDQSWQEETVTWNTAPAAVPTLLTSLASVSSGNWYEVDLTPLITGEGTYSLRITSTLSDGADYSSKEGANAPQLIIETTS